MEEMGFSGKIVEMIKYELGRKSPFFVALLSGFLSLNFVFTAEC